MIWSDGLNEFLPRLFATAASCRWGLHLYKYNCISGTLFVEHLITLTMFYLADFPAVFFHISFGICHGTQLTNPNNKSQLIRAINNVLPGRRAHAPLSRPWWEWSRTILRILDLAQLCKHLQHPVAAWSAEEECLIRLIRLIRLDVEDWRCCSHFILSPSGEWIRIWNMTEWGWGIRWARTMECLVWQRHSCHSGISPMECFFIFVFLILTLIHMMIINTLKMNGPLSAVLAIGTFLLVSYFVFAVANNVGPTSLSLSHHTSKPGRKVNSCGSKQSTTALPSYICTNWLQTSGTCVYEHRQRCTDMSGKWGFTLCSADRSSAMFRVGPLLWVVAA